MNGLNDAEVLFNRKKYGSNELNKYNKNTFLKMLLESLGDPIIKILLIALGIKVFFLFQSFDWFETIGILLAIFIATFISTLSEYGSEKAFESLNNENINSKSIVKRNNKLIEVNSNEIVVNDIVLLKSGDLVCADGEIISGYVIIDESSLNGESKEKKKSKNDIVYRGSVVLNNEAYLKVIKVGINTIYGSIAKELQEKTIDSPLKIRLRNLAKIISRIGYVGAILVTLSYLFNVIIINNNFDLNIILLDLKDFKFMMETIIYALTLSVTIIVVAVPEGLPMMITLVLSSNMKKLLKSNVLVRKLVGIETSGSLNMLLFDKTGTITKGSLEVISFVSGDNKVFNNINELKKYDNLYKKIETSLFYNNDSVFDEEFNIINGNQTDKALLKYIGSIKKNINILDKQHFDSTLKYSSITTENSFYIKGAPEKIINHCNYYYDGFGRKKSLNKNCINIVNEYTKKGNRVIALAMKENDIRDINNLILIGFILIKDDIRPEARIALDIIKNAHINTIMITGDAKETAINIAKEIKLLNDNSIVLTSEEFNNKSDNEIKEILYNIKVIARALPTDKSRLVRISQDLNLVVGMTGDGVNDAPALKKADVGFAMGSGTEVAKEASDIIILDDNILSISESILFGRTIFKSIRKFIILQLTINLCALTLSIIGPFIGIETPITIIQMLWINMIMDTLSGVAFSYEAPLKEYMFEYPKAKNESIINKYMYGEILFTGIYSSILCIIFLKSSFLQSFFRYDINGNYLKTAYFSLFIFISLFNAFNARTERINILANILKNKMFLFIMGNVFVVQMYLIYNGGNLFRTYGLSIQELIIVMLLGISVIPIDILRKLVIKKFNLNKGV